MIEQYLLQLMMSKGIGNVALRQILKHASTYSQDYLKQLCHHPEELTNIIKVRNDTVSSVLLNAEPARALWEEITKREIVIITELDPLYPKSLKRSLGKDCPAVLFAQGNVNLLETTSVGFCGSRKVSSKGAFITEQCAQQLVGQGITVVSGYAAGTDLYAHTSALTNKGNTVFVLAEGILKFSKKQAVKSYLSNENHVYISQFLPNSLWSAANAMKRNSVIIGLSQAMILVESGRHGGTFAAGEETLKRSLPLFVIDFEKPEVSAEANPYFIEKGGHPIRGKRGIPNLEKVLEAVNHPQSNDSGWEQLTF